MTGTNHLLSRRMEHADWPAVEAIWAAGIASGHSTFEPAPPSWEDFDATRHPQLRLVAKDHGNIVGWVAASPVSSRTVYRGVVEHSIYIAQEARGRGYGAQLLDAFVRRTEEEGIWTIQSNIFPENAASIALHQRHGFTVVGTRQRIGLMSYGPAAGSWRDTVLLERRAE
ncbi:GNAT family N-acetyltransferase [Paenarthrobacter sp. JL.01a]|uniref:GNAT family N-acetyltransferase n=1 Tax=Paenarthrobacter sp. JL.01a TaxID=2979324 RepID=UPI0021C758A9|nr:GNAT family N-acetyltransferase [Paenarthrobacter sp. JL.01a]UXM93041.1 GNAT family N-acetyltransferase [Paenarthrobacter sp. JL.01a]